MTGALGIISGSRRDGARRHSRSLTALAASLALVSIVLVTAADPSGALPADLDPTFAANGVAITGSPQGSFTAVAVQPDGKVVAAGDARDAETNTLDFQIVRYLPDGRLDPTFGSGGRVFTDLGDYEAIADLALQTDGRILVLGNKFTKDSGFHAWIAARYNVDGTPDESFGEGGVLYLGGRNGQASAETIVVQPDGRILVAAWADEWVHVLRRHSEGSEDSTFDFQMSRPGDQVTVAIQPSGRILVSSVKPRTVDGGGGGAVVQGLMPDGSLDPTFASGGVATLADRGTSRDMTIQSDGKILLVGSPTSSGAEPRFRLTRLTVDGAVDTSFGQGGQVTTRVGDAATASGEQVAVGVDGTVTVAGWASASAGEILIPNRVFVAQLSPAGTFRPGFGASGIATYLVANASGSAPQDLAIQPDGKPVVVGYSPDPVSGRHRGFVARVQGRCAEAVAPCAQPRSILVALHSGKVIAGPVSSRTPGMLFNQWDWNGGLNQQLRLEPLSNGAYKIVSTSTGMVLDVGGGSKAEGANIVQWPWNGGANQQWAAYPFGNQNVVVLISLNSGLALSVAGGSLATGTRLTQSRWVGGLNQIWLRATF